MKKFLFLFFLIHFLNTKPKVLIITHCYNRPEFIELQHKTFKKFLQDDFELVVFNDAKTDQMAHQISSACSNCGIRCIRIPQEIHTRPYLSRRSQDNFQSPHIRHANCIQYSFDVLGFNHDGIVFLIDSDMFLIRPLSIEQYMKDKHIAAKIKIELSGIHYVWPGLCILDMSKLPDKKTLNFNAGVINGSLVDSGGFTYNYLSKHPEVTVTRLNYLYSHQLFLPDRHYNKMSADQIEDIHKAVFYSQYGFNKREISFLLKKPDTIEFCFDLNLLHYREGSNYSQNPAEYHNNKFKIFKEFLNEVLAS